MRYTSFGPGDSQTWPPCYGHPNDPRTDDLFPEDEDQDDLFDDEKFEPDEYDDG